MFAKHRVSALGGIATRAELFAHGCTKEEIDLAVRYGWILSVRKGMYANRDLDATVLRALRIGGRLACVSAIAWCEGRALPADERLHVLVRGNASRLGEGSAVIHWSRRPVSGSRGIVDEEIARRQAATCRASR